jgi:hypothetical protein
VGKRRHVAALQTRSKERSTEIGWQNKIASVKRNGLNHKPTELENMKFFAWLNDQQQRPFDEETIQQMTMWFLRFGGVPSNAMFS